MPCLLQIVSLQRITYGYLHNNFFSWPYQLLLQYVAPYFHTRLYFFFFLIFFFYFNFFFLHFLLRDTFYNLATMFNSISLQLAFDFMTIFHVENIHCKQLFKMSKKIMRRNRYNLYLKKFILFLLLLIISFYHILVILVPQEYYCWVLLHR